MTTLGIDIRAERATCALFEGSGKNLEFKRFWEVPFEGDTPAAELLAASLARECPTAPEAVATALPGRQVSHRILHLPFRETSKLQATIPFEIESEVPLDIESSVVAWKLLGEASHSATVLAAVARNEDVAQHLEFLEQAGIDPALITLGTLAIGDLLPPDSGTTLLIDVHPDGGLALLEDGEVRRLHLLGSPDTEGLHDEISWAATAYKTELPDRVVLTGDPDLIANLQLPDELKAEPLVNPTSCGTTPVPGEALRAAALAKSASDGSAKPLNFRTGEFVYHAPSEEAHRQLRRTGWIGAAAALVLLGTWLLMFAERRAELAALRTEITTQTSTIAPRAPRGTEVRRVRAALEQLEKKASLLGGTSAGAPTLDQLLAIHAAIPEQVPLEVADLTLDPAGVRFRGRTDTFESVDIVSSALASLPEFTTANVQDVKAGVDGRIEFRATLETRGGS